MNGGFCFPIFSGLRGDERRLSQKMAGILGYFLACVVVWPVGALIFSVKKILPICFIFVVGILISPVVAIYKWVNQYRHPRFEENNDSDVETSFKNIYSSLNAFGNLKEGEAISEHQSGRKGVLCFIRKTTTGNIPTLTEETLDTLLDAYRNSNNKGGFFNHAEEYEDAVETVKGKYKSTEKLESQHYKNIRNGEIDRVSEFLTSYIQNHDTEPQHIYETEDTSWSSVFYGKRSSVGGLIN